MVHYYNPHSRKNYCSLKGLPKIDVLAKRGSQLGSWESTCELCLQKYLLKLDKVKEQEGTKQ